MQGIFKIHNLFFSYFFLYEKLIWADVDYELVESISSIINTYNVSLKGLLECLCLTFAVVCLLLLEFYSWKKKFWHGPGISSGPSLKNTLFDCIQIIFASCWNRWTMSDRINIFNLFLGPFTTSWLQKKWSLEDCSKSND